MLFSGVVRVKTRGVAGRSILVKVRLTATQHARVDCQTRTVRTPVIIMSEIITPTTTLFAISRGIIEHRGAVRHMHDQIAGRAQPNAATERSPRRYRRIFTDESIVEMRSVGFCGDVNATALLVCNIALDKASIQLDSVGDRVHAAAGAGGRVLLDGATVHREPARRDLTPFFGLELAAHAVARNLCKRALRSPHIQIHGIHAATVGRLVLLDSAAIHRDSRVTENVHAAAAKGRTAIGNLAIVDHEC